MKKFSGLLSRTKSSDNSNIDSPEANVARGIRLFCESGAPDNAGEEVLHLPVIVESAESSPNAAASAAYTIRKFLSKDNYNRPHVQYNAIMLIRILSDNPGPSFNRNIDVKFVATVKTLLKEGKDPSVQQILRETLDSLEFNKSLDEGLMPLISMWRHMKGHTNRLAPQAPRGHVSGSNPTGGMMDQGPQGNQRAFAREQLPAPHELSSRVEESKNTAKILMQLIQSTPTEEITTNELVKEFAERCQAAQRSMQGYINCDSPPADDDTMQTLIETNEQLSLSMSRYQRALLSARRALGARGASPHPEAQFQSPPPASTSLFSPLEADQAPGISNLSPVSPESANSLYGSVSQPPASMTSRMQDRQSPYAPVAPTPRRPEPASDPFADHAEVSEYPAHPMEPAHYGSPPRQLRNDQQRPPMGTHYDGGPTESYVGRQASAVNGLTMHGADLDDVSEVDGDSREGRVGDRGMNRQPVAYRY